MQDAAPIKLTLSTARRLAIAKQHLAGKQPTKRGPSAILDLMEDLRYLQIDPTSAVAPSHLLVLWSRLGAFRQSDLDKLMWKDKKLFENWARHASIVLTEDYPLFLPRSSKFATGNHVWPTRLREWMKENEDLRSSMVRELKARGPLSSRDFEDRSESRWTRSRRRWGLKESAWSSGRDVSRMLEFLFHDGTISVAGRMGRQKLWDLTERFLPDWTPRDELSDDEVEYLGAQHSLRALGVATPKQVAWHFLIGRYPHLKETLKTLEADGKVLPVELAQRAEARGRWYMHVDDVGLAERITLGEWEPRTTLLSPFDNLIIDRDRTEELFDYFFRIEIYTPREKRKHGFFVMSILDGDRIVGRIDPVMDRRSEELVVRAVHAEPGAPEGRAAARRVAEAVDGLGEFLGAKRVVYPARVPEKWRGSLR